MASSTLNIGNELHGESLIYRIESVLGQGSFGITYKAKAFTVIKGKFGEELVETSRPKAIKEFFMKEVNERNASGSITGMSEGSLSYNYAQKFKKEAENLASMNHPNIVKVIDFISANNTYYYVMDFIEGENLNDYLKTHKLSEEDATSIIIEVAKTLKYMHEEKHMLHLDLKPGNIMRRESDGHIFLIDFGLSKHYSDNGVPETSTSIGLGTLGYAPIEQANSRNAKQFRTTLDIYALGATFYKLLTGQTPPPADELVSEEEMVRDVLQKCGVSERVIAVIEQAMLPIAKYRTQSVREFLSAFYTTADSNEATDETTSEATVVSVEPTQKEPQESFQKKEEQKEQGKEKKKQILWLIAGCCFFVIIVVFIINKCSGTSDNDADEQEIVDALNVLIPDTFTVNGVSFVMMPVEGGTFQMGATSEQGSDGDSDEKPVHGVTLSSYYIGQTEVTQALWWAVMGGKSSYKADNNPMENVSWENCQNFINKLNQLTGQKFRLPTEAEWEYAARGGRNSKGYKYSGSNTLGDVAWYDDNSDDYIHPVAMKQANELGLYDMSGNVWEWCQDLYGENYYKNSPNKNPTGPTSGSSRVIRGGCWCNSDRDVLRVSCRFSTAPSNITSTIGLRLAL